MPASSKPAPPQLHFDDGSRVMADAGSNSNVGLTSSKNADQNIAKSERGEVPFREYYEIDNICDQIIERLDLVRIHSTANVDNSTSDENKSTSLPFLCKIALQFPDELLPDADEVCWAMEEGIQKSFNEQISKVNSQETQVLSLLSPLVFVLGDTTYGSCCVDEVAALHLNADLIVHYGNACLSPTSNLPVIYSFGSTPMKKEEENECVDLVLKEMETLESKRLLILYNVRYHHSIPRIVEKIQHGGVNDVIMGKIPEQHFLKQNKGPKRLDKCGESGMDCCNVSTNDSPGLDTDGCCRQTVDKIMQTNINNDQKSENEQKALYIGGLQVVFPNNDSTLSDYTLLYIGQNCRQMVNIMLRCSGKDGAAACWSYTFDSGTNFSTDASNVCRRELNRRFYLTEKARMASIIGIVVGTLGVSRFQSVVTNLRKRIEASGRGCYTLVVGKVNVAKLANFGEIETFVLVACPENSMLDSRDFHVPVITPMEMEIALGEREWDGFYSNDFSDFLGSADLDRDEDRNNDNEGSEKDDSGDDDDDDDKPHFSLISGSYVSNPKVSTDQDLDLRALPGKGQMTAYNSEAAKFLQKREYQGLESDIGKTEVAPASKGQTGIASDYGNR